MRRPAHIVEAERSAAAEPKARQPRKKPATPAERRAKFTAEYLRTGNATQSAIAAGYSAKTAHAAGHRLLKHVEVQRPVQRALRNYEVTAQRVVHELALLSFSNMRDFVDDQGRVLGVHELGDDQAAAIRKLKSRRRIELDPEGKPRAEEIETELELTDKRQALALLGQHTGIFKDGADSPAQFILVIARPRTRAEREQERQEGLRNVTPGS